jgi:hypothetical protein
MKIVQAARTPSASRRLLNINESMETGGKVPLF